MERRKLEVLVATREGMRPVGMRPE
jgi:hypothetical protein